MGLRNAIRARRGYLDDQRRVAELASFRAADQRALEKRDFINAANRIDCAPWNLKAFHQVESRGAGFDSKGRLKMLYEPHVVHKRTNGTLSNQRVSVLWKNSEIMVPLSYPKWRRNPRGMREFHPYDLDFDSRWQLLAAAYRRHPAAIEGASYGAFQIMGYWSERLGYGSTLNLIRDLYEGEKNHLAAAIRFLRMAEAFDDLRRGNWEALARKYNGNGAVPIYAPKLKRAAELARSEFQTGKRVLRS